MLPIIWVERFSFLETYRLMIFKKNYKTFLEGN